jgi:TolB-like protein/DNA-binding winged helix-turn-helix (wHTH) protein/Tfp pilus assembly protein PilF
MNRMSGDLSETGSGAFIVGDLHIDVGQQRVTRAGSDIALPNLSFRLLVALVHAAPNVISNDALMTQVWPGLVVSPETVNKRVNLLREALGDDPREPRYIAGIRSRGYRMIAPVSAASDAARPLDLPAPLAEIVPPPREVPIPAIAAQALQTGGPKLRSGRGRWIVLWVLATALLAAAAFGIRSLVRHPSQVVTAVPGAMPAAIGASARTVAVLRFDSISADSADAYLAQGLPEMILNRLSRINGLSVIARNSSFSLDTKTLDSREIGRRLNSGYLIDGSVQRKSDRLRVAVQLVDTAAGTQVWSAHFDRALGDIFNVEDEIADQVADALAARLGGLEARPVRAERSGNIEAYLAYLRGRTLLGRFNLAESDSAVPYLEKAMALDPHFAAAYASLYDARMQAADQRREDLHLVRRRYGYLIDKALELDPKLGAAYFARAMWGEQPHDSSAIAGSPLIVARERDFRQGAALDPSNGRGLTAYAEFLYHILNRTDEGKSVLKRALWVDPMSPSAHFTDATFSLDDGGPKAAEQKTLQVLELDPDFVPALQYYGTYRWLFDGKLAEATQIVEHALALDPGNSQLHNVAVSMYLDFGDLEAAREVAAATPHSERTTALLLMHEGDWRGAGLAAYDETGWTSDDDYCQNWLAGAAIRDYALKTGELGRAIAFIKLKYYFGDAPAAHLDYCNNGAAVDLSQLLAASGEAQQALALRRAAVTWSDANQAKYLGGARRLRARILLLDGKTDAALAELAESFRSGEYALWWYAVEHDPLWLPLHSDARFQLIAADVQRYIGAQRGELEALRRNGLVPRRGVAVTSR